jgi:hypothetical protein
MEVQSNFMKEDLRQYEIPARGEASKVDCHRESASPFQTACVERSTGAD